MSVNLHILKASDRLNPFEQEIRGAFEFALAQIEERLKLPSVDVIVVDNPDAAIPETGVGGFAPTAHLLYMSVDPNHSDLKNNIATETKSTVAHELHHCARWQAVGYGKTLLEAIVSEGLADHFDLEINGGQPKPWSIAVQGEVLAKLKERARAEYHNQNYNHWAWFFGSDDIPRWAAYSLGFQIVKEYLQKTGKSAAKLVGEDAKAFV